MIERIKEGFSQIQGHLWGRPLDVQRALRATGVQMPDDLDLITVIKGLSDHRVDRAADWLRLKAFRDGCTADGEYFTIKSEPGLLGRITRIGDLCVHCCQAPNSTEAFRLSFLHLGEIKSAMADNEVRDYKFKFRHLGLDRVLVFAPDSDSARRKANELYPDLKHLQEVKSEYKD